MIIDVPPGQRRLPDAGRPVEEEQGGDGDVLGEGLGDDAEGFLGLAHEPLHQLAGRDELVDAADALAGRPELAVGVDVGRWTGRRRGGWRPPACS